jgi:glycosyltransferase involved in cell wall biosynthesis
MRIALIHYSAPPVVGGVERVLGHHATLLADAGHEVTIVAARGHPSDPRIRFVRIGLVDSRDPTVVALQSDLDAGHLPASFDDVRDLLVDSLAATLSGHDLAICHNVASINMNLALTAALHELTMRPGFPRLVLWHHDVAAAQPSRGASLHDGYPWDLLHTAWPGAVQVAISEVRRGQLAAVTGLPHDAIAVVPNGVDVAGLLGLHAATRRLLATTAIEEADPLLLMPVRVMPRKNVELGLRVVAAMRAEGRPAGLLVTGPADPHDSPESGYLTRLLLMRDAFGLRDAAWFPGTGMHTGLTEVVVADLYAIADALFLPSHDEGFGIPLLEAAIFRLPIVCSDLPIMREVAGDAALYVGPADDPGDVARRILASLDANPVARLAGRTRRESSWTAVYRRWIAPLLEAAASRSPGAMTGRR